MVGPGKPKLPLELLTKAGVCARVTAGPKRLHVIRALLPTDSRRRLGFPGPTKEKPEIPVVARESRRNSRKTTWFPRISSRGRPHPEVRREGRERLPDHAGDSPLLSRSLGEKGLIGSGSGTLGVPLGGTRRVGGLLGVAGRLSGTVSPFRPCG